MSCQQAPGIKYRLNYRHDLGNRFILKSIYVLDGGWRRKHYAYFSEPRAEVYCFRLNFNISKLVYYLALVKTWFSV